ncbi:hypothetical protein GN958_ATG05168 [Phytophthora infestans]|uniref:Uncharacterized protein n=1 Tax=Phytophthora infestans TaxID=4787 RepID=A0A8S9V2P1_PHYIN|nr:hypothetical protein GN958_ATG05168 [Phytophthora infestans]
MTEDGLQMRTEHQARATKQEGVDGRQDPDGEPEHGTANSRHQPEHEEGDGNIASRTRSKIRRAPYRGTEREDAEGREQEFSGSAGTLKLRRITHEEDEEPRGYVFAGRGRRGFDSLVSTLSRLARIGPTDTVVER